LPLKLVNDRTSIYAAHFNYLITDVMTLPIDTTVGEKWHFFPTSLTTFRITWAYCQTDAATGLIAAEL
jgi:hypothetical protein